MNETIEAPATEELETESTTGSQLTGPELLALVKKLNKDGASKSEITRSAGYYSTKKDGTERLNFTAFQEALLAANGVSLGSERASGGRKLTYRTKTQFNGNLLVGSAYTKLAGFEPGDEFEIKVGKGGFTLKALAREQSSSEAACSMPEVDSGDCTNSGEVSND